MSAEHHGPQAALDHRSALPRIPGIPWWGAIALAITTTAIGFAYDAGTGDKELSGFFSFCYFAGCILAVLAVRRSGVFTAVIQPPLILFVSVPGAYFLFHGAKIGGIKDILINCGYPLIERFPLMFFTALTVLVLGLVRWFVLPRFQGPAPEADQADSPRRSRRAEEPQVAKAAAAGGLAAALSAKLTKLTTGRSPRTARSTPGRTPARPAPAAARRSAGTGRPTRPRPADTEVFEQPVRRPQRPSRPRPATGAPYGSDEPRRSGREPYPPQRSGRPDQHRTDPRRADAPPRRRHYADDPREPVDRYDARPAPRGSAPGGARDSVPNGARHPVSRVRYRGADDAEQQPRPERRPDQQRSWDADSWRYDV